MGFDIVFTEDQEERVVRNHSKQVAESLREMLKQKSHQLRHIDSLGKLVKRFRARITENLFEGSFDAERRDYRVFLYAVEERKVLVFVELVRKSDRFGGSRQDHMIQGLTENIGEVQEYAEEITDKVRE